MSLEVGRRLPSRVLYVLLLLACSTEDPDESGSNAGTGSPAGGAAGTMNAAAGTAAGSSAGTASGTGAPVAGMAAGSSAGSAAGNGAVAGTAAGAGTAGTAGDGAPMAGTGSMPSGSADWAMMGYDLGSTFYNAAESAITKDNVATLTEAWTADFGANVYGAALQVGDKIYASGGSFVRGFDAATGNQLWSASVGGSGALAFHEGKLYFNRTGSNIVSIDAGSGNVLWEKPQNPASEGDGTSSPLVVGDLIVTGGSNGSLELTTGNFRGYMSAIDLMTGDSKWVEYTVPMGATGASIWSSPSADLGAGVIYGTTGNNYGGTATDTSDAFIAFDMATGAIKWKNQRVMNDTFGGSSGFIGGPDADFGANPVVYEAMVEGVLTKLVGAGSKGGEAHAVRADNGELVWTRPLCSGRADGSEGIFTNATWTGKDLMVACNVAGGRATIYALDGGTGNTSWMRDVPGSVWGRSAAANGVGYVGVGATLEILDLDTGAQIHSVPSKGGTVASTITVAHGRVAFGEGLSWSNGVRGTTLTVLKLP